MRGALGSCAAIVVFACALVSLSPGVASAGHSGKDCGVVSRGSNDYRVHAMRLKCRVARKGSIRYLRTQEPRTGFDCAPTAGGSFYCQDPPKAYWGVRL